MRSPSNTRWILLPLSVGALGLALQFGHPGVAQDSASSRLDDAVQAIYDYEGVINARDAQGQYIAQSEGVASLSSRLSPHVTQDILGVSGLGFAEEVLGQVPTGWTLDDFSASVILNQQLAIVADLMSGGTGQADWVHTLHSGEVRGRMARVILNFQVMGSGVDAQGNRLPVEIPLSLIDPTDPRSLTVSGRCICVCEKSLSGQWQVNTFYFVQTDPPGLFPTN